LGAPGRRGSWEEFWFGEVEEETGEGRREGEARREGFTGTVLRRNRVAVVGTADGATRPLGLLIVLEGTFEGAAIPLGILGDSEF